MLGKARCSKVQLLAHRNQCLLTTNLTLQDKIPLPLTTILETIGFSSNNE